MNTTNGKLSRCSIVSTLILSLLFAAQSSASSFDELKLSYEIKLDKIRKSKTDQTNALRLKYSEALARHKEASRKAGELETVLRYDEEIRSAKDSTKPLPQLAADSPTEMQSARQIYDQHLVVIERKSAEELGAASEKMDALLETMVSALTKADDLKGAKAAKSYREKIGDNPEIAAARDLVQNVPKGGVTRPAMRVRRSDDNIEVIVRFDSRGKVSMDSPVENTREKYAQQPTQLQTKAKTLGEFVGAKGFKVDPYVKFDQTFDEATSGRFVLAELVPKFRSRAEGEVGMGFSVAPKPKNPHARVHSVMSPQPGSCSYLVTCRYFIPKDNETLIGFGFVDGIGTAIGGEMFDTKGKWTTEGFSGPASHTSTNMVMKMTRTPKLFTDPGDEFIILGNLKVEYIKFSAFICEEFGLDGKVSKKYEILKQPALVVNGGSVKRPR